MAEQHELSHRLQWHLSFRQNIRTPGPPHTGINWKTPEQR